MCLLAADAARNEVHAERNRSGHGRLHVPPFVRTGPHRNIRMQRKVGGDSEFKQKKKESCCFRCKCAATCLNRVVQNPLQHKLQVFKTVNRGWGIRCINDIPQGAFICIYAGALLTDQMANEVGGGDSGLFFRVPNWFLSVFRAASVTATSIWPNWTTSRWWRR